MDQTQDQTIVCVDCRQSFAFTAGEQAFYSEKGFTPPKRCKLCRDARKERQGERDVARMQTTSYEQPATEDRGNRRARGGRRERDW